MRYVTADSRDSLLSDGAVLALRLLSCIISNV